MTFSWAVITATVCFYNLCQLSLTLLAMSDVMAWKEYNFAAVNSIKHPICSKAICYNHPLQFALNKNETEQSFRIEPQIFCCLENLPLSPTAIPTTFTVIPVVYAMVTFLCKIF